MDADTAVTQVTRRPRPAGPGYAPPFEPRRPRRQVWPWLAGVGALLALIVGGFLLFDTVRSQFEGAETVAVPYVVALRQAQAEADIADKGLVPRVRPVSSSDVEEGFVISQRPTEGTRVDKGEIVFIDVSSGKPEVTVPSVVGQSETDAVEELTRAGLDAQIFQVNSELEEGRVTAQKPAAGLTVVEGTRVRINVSQGPKPVTVPNVVNIPYDQAAAELRQAGFDVRRIDVDSDLAKGIVVDQDPSAASESSKGSTITLSVSKGPVTEAVPDVTTQPVENAQTALEVAGFRTRVQLEDTDDPTLDGIVISQDPAGGSQAKPDSVVTLFVGRFTGTTTETTPTTP